MPTFLTNFLKHVNSGKSAANGGAVPLDFISFHAKGKPTIEAGKVTMGINRELKDADRGFAMVTVCPVQGPSHYPERGGSRRDAPRAHRR